MSGTKTSFCLLLVALLTFTACADEQERGRKWCRKAAQLAGSFLLSYMRRTFLFWLVCFDKE